MPAPIDFYFDFTSPYGYIFAQHIDDLAARHGRSTVWHPFLLGMAFKTTGAVALPEIPLKGEYALRDIQRSARFMGVPYRHPTRFPLPTQNAARSFYWLQDHHGALAKPFALACLRALFVEDRDISSPAVVLDVAAAVGVDRAALEQALADPAVKDRLRSETEAAIARGVFGSPFTFIDGEPFWGGDRMPQIERWLATGGF
ncbi:MAG: 2-hydroxychromene-2-carboxylate isomerase [Rhodocyclaceae bacterium]|nr:2-hydroxychromene-2-carboxylate isomerase [Rhodocyclaceae bacterium]